MSVAEYRLYEDKASWPKTNAQLNLACRTHYADDSSLRFFHARILSARPACGGRLFCIIESVALDMDNTKRGFRGVVFDVCGNVVSRAKLEDAKRTREAARKAMWAEINAMDVAAITEEAIKREEGYLAASIAILREQCAKAEAVAKGEG